ncbi:MAG: magnesium transporter CorA [Candidatus Micrarchaeota archaeon]|nr:magnesium transporter CorA [Candidatus Micrarchaeota archaeon]
MDRKAEPGENITDAKAFCSSLLRDGTTIKQIGRRPTDFAKLIAWSSVSWADFVVDDVGKEAEDIARSLEFSRSLIANIMNGRISGYEDYDDELGILVPAVTVEGFDVTTNPLIILIKSNLVVTIHSGKVVRFERLRRYAETMMRKIPVDASQQDKVTHALIRIIDENNGRNFDHLREIEAQGDKLSQSLIDVNAPRELIGPEIYHMKHALLSYLNSLWATVDVINALRYGDAELLTDDPRLLARIGALSADVNNQISLAEHLSEVLASGLEVLQSIYNNQLQILNNKMAMVTAYLAVIGTAVLVPNTLATILSNPAFNMGPQDTGWYIAMLVGSTLVATAISFWWVQKKGWLPKNIH